MHIVRDKAWATTIVAPKIGRINDHERTDKTNVQGGFN